MVATANVMRAFSHALDPDTADEKALRRYERAGLTIPPLLDGGFAIAGTADETTGAAIVAAVDAASPLVTGDTRTAARRRLDGLHRICRHWLDTAAPDGDTADPPRGAPASPGPGSIVTIDQRRVRRAHLTRRHPVLAGPIAASTAQRLGCDSDATFVTLDADGNVVEAGSQRRFFTHSQILAMIARDGDTLLRPLLRPAVGLVRRAPPHPRLPGRADHHRQRRPALRRPPRPAPRRPLDTRTPPRRPLPHAPPRHRQDPRARTTPTRPQPTTPRRTARVRVGSTAALMSSACPRVTE